MNIWHLFSERRPPFASPTGFYSVRHRIYVPSSDYSLQAPTVYIRLITASIYQVVFTVCRFQRFLFCLSPYLFSEWHIVPLLCIQIKQSRVHSRKALYECKASRRLGKQMRCFYQFLSKAHPYSRFIQQPKLRIPSSPYRSNHLSFPSAEVQILPFYIPFPTL